MNMPTLTFKYAHDLSFYFIIGEEKVQYHLFFSFKVINLFALVVQLLLLLFNQLQLQQQDLSDAAALRVHKA